MPIDDTKIHGTRGYVSCYQGNEYMNKYNSSTRNSPTKHLTHQTT